VPISQQTIDAVYDAIRVEEVIGDYVQLKKSGSNFKGLSPFSDEKSPSFMVSPAKQIWKDFSSGKGGNAISFLMEHEHFSYPEAIKHLAKKYGIEVQETQQTDAQKQQSSERESMYLVSEYANSFFQQQLHNTDTGKAIALSYFKERGFTTETIKKFQLGYSPDVWDALTNSAIKKSYKLKYLESTGLTIVKENKQFDRFKGRIMFPIHSMSGRVLGFGGRILGNNPKAAKYLNSPESDIYHKSKVLYGIYYAKQSIAKEDNCYLVEGYTDVIQFHQSGITNTVSSSGTALTSDQIRLINRLTNNITVLFDGDAAGMRAAIRGIDLILEQGMNVRVCTFPDGEDPDSFAKKHSEDEIKNYLQQNSQDFIQFKAKLLQQEASNDPVKKAGVIRSIVESISKIPDPIQREVYIQECSASMGISEEVLFSSLAQTNANPQRKTSSKPTQAPPTYETQPLRILKPNTPSKKVNTLYVLERTIIGILLLYGSEEQSFTEMIYKESEEGELQMVPETYNSTVYEKVFLDLQEDEIEFSNEAFKEVYSKLINAYNQGNQFRIDAFMHELSPELSTEISNILMQDEKYRLDDWQRNEIYVKSKSSVVADYTVDVILNLRRKLVDLKINDLMEQMKTPPQEENPPINITEILQEIMGYQHLKRVLAEQLNRVL